MSSDDSTVSPSASSPSALACRSSACSGILSSRARRSAVQRSGSFATLDALLAAYRPPAVREMQQRLLAARERMLFTTFQFSRLPHRATECNGCAPSAHGCAAAAARAQQLRPGVTDAAASVGIGAEAASRLPSSPR